jgi:hypothetical protein
MLPFPPMRLQYFRGMRNLLLISTFCFSVLASAQSDAPWQFAGSLSSTSFGQLFSLFLVKVEDGKVVETRPLTRLDFVHQAQGRAKSPANPDSVDFFLKYQVPSCFLPPDSTAMGYHHSDCIMLDELWKLRFQEYPLQGAQHMPLGWSGKKLAPDEHQMSILNGYGMSYPKALIIGDKFFRLLHDIGDRQWIVNYRNG